MSPSTPPASWILSRWLPDLLLLYSKNRNPFSPTPLPAPGPLSRKSSRHNRGRQLTPGKLIQPRLFSASLPCLPHRLHDWNPAIYKAPPATTEHTKPPPITPRIRRFASTGNQESNVPMHSQTPLVSSDLLNPAGDHGVHQTATEHH